MMNEESELDEFAPWMVMIITVIGGFLRVLLLESKGMWLDETFSVWLANHSVLEMLQWIVRIDQHPPLYYLLLHSWIAHNGDSPYYARLLSVLFGAATIPVIYLIGKRLSGVVLGLAAAIFLAVSPYNIAFSQEARMYTLLTLNAAVAMYALIRLLTDPRSAMPIGSQFREYLHAWRTLGPVEPEIYKEFSYEVETRSQGGWKGWIYRHRWNPIQTIETDLAWVVLVVFSAATLLTHNTAVFFTLAANIFVLGLILYQRMKKPGSPSALQAPSLGNWVKSQIIIFLLWCPWILAFLRQARAVDQRFWIPKPTWDAVLHVFKFFLNASAPLPTGQALAMWSLYVLVLCLGLLHFRKSISRFIFLATLIAVPVLAELLVSIRRPIFYDRTLIWISIPLFLLLAAGIAQLKHRLLIVVVLGVLATNNLFSAGDYYRFYQKEDWSTAAGYVAKFAEKDDLVLFNSNFVEIPFDYYFKPYEQLYSIQIKRQGIPQDLIEDGVLEPMMTESDVPELISMLRGHDRVWLVYSHDSYTDPLGLIPQTLASQMKLLKTREFYGGQVQLYGTP
ncbi:MAG: glycosyltransferase family 39 protein [Bacteroidota bacterium]